MSIVLCKNFFTNNIKFLFFSFLCHCSFKRKSNQVKGKILYSDAYMGIYTLIQEFLSKIQNYTINSDNLKISEILKIKLF